MEPISTERRLRERIPSSLPVRVTVDGAVWTGTCINVSVEGALLKLEGPWAGAEQIAFELDPDHGTESLPVPARVIRASSPDHLGTFLAVKFLGPS